MPRSQIDSFGISVAPRRPWSAAYHGQSGCRSGLHCVYSAAHRRSGPAHRPQLFVGRGFSLQQVNLILPPIEKTIFVAQQRVPRVWGKTAHLALNA